MKKSKENKLEKQGLVNNRLVCNGVEGKLKTQQKLISAYKKILNDLKTTNQPNRILHRDNEY